MRLDARLLPMCHRKTKRVPHLPQDALVTGDQHCEAAQWWLSPVGLRRQ